MFTSLDNFLRWIQFSSFYLKFKIIQIYQTVKMEINEIVTFSMLQKEQTEWNFRKTAQNTKKRSQRKYYIGNVWKKIPFSAYSKKCIQIWDWKI